MHWHSECPNRNKNFKPKAATKPEQTQDNDANNAVNDDTTGVSPKDNFATVSASIGKTELLATVDSASTVNLMPFIFAKSLRLHIDFEDVKLIRMAKGKVQTSGTVQFKLTINTVTKRIKVLVLKNFTYCLLLGVPTCRAFDLTVHFGTLTITGPPQAAQAVHTQQLTQLFSSIKKQRQYNTHNSDRVHCGKGFTHTHTTDLRVSTKSKSDSNNSIGQSTSQEISNTLPMALQIWVASRLSHIESCCPTTHRVHNDHIVNHPRTSKRRHGRWTSY